MRILSKRFYFVFLLVLAVFALFHTVASAQNPQDKLENNTFDSFNAENQSARKEAERTGNTQVYLQASEKASFDAKVYSLTRSIVCTDPDPKNCNPQNTALGTVAKGFIALYSHPPASGVMYVQNILTNAGILAQPVYAQGIGFAGLAPLLPFWQATRNVAYVVLIIVMIAIGFMVIFRMKIDPKTVISVQAALPKIVLTLLLITFSYPIVGFLIDLMYLVMALCISLIVNSVGASHFAGLETAELQSRFLNADFGTLLYWAFWGQLVPVLAGAGGTLFGWFAASSTFGLFALVPSLIIGLMFALGLLYSALRLLILVFNCYIQIIINLILSPLILLNEAIPGRSAFSDWFVTMLANLSVFPATAAIMLFATFVTSQDLPGLWSAPFVGAPVGSMFRSLLGLAIIFQAPQLVAAVKKSFNPKSAVPISAGSAFSPLTGGLSTGMGAMSQLYYAQPILGWFNKLRGQPSSPSASGGAPH